MSVVVFTGPTIAPEDARMYLDAVYLPPAARGDVYRAASQRPAAIGLIDGLFERVLAVAHKEILWAMDRGIHVFGGSSMGALRAAELAPFGMEGVGAIFEAFRDGVLEDDDEVAVRHGPADVGYRGLSEAKVNIRATLQAAQSAGIVSQHTGDALLSLAGNLFYPERAYPRLLDLARSAGLPPAELDALTIWLPSNHVDQKRSDAVAMLRLIRDRMSAGLAPKEVMSSFQHTIFFDRLQRSVDRSQSAAGMTVGLGNLLDEVRLAGDYGEARRGAAERMLAIEEARRRGVKAGDVAAKELEHEVRRGYGLSDGEEFGLWLTENGLTADEAHRFFADSALQRWTESTLDMPISAHIADYLRSTGDYPGLADRARRKQRLLSRRGLSAPTAEDLLCSDQELLAWHFESRLGSSVPRDISVYARSAGFPDQSAFLNALRREYLYVHLAKERNPQQAVPSARSSTECAASDGSRRGPRKAPRSRLDNPPNY